MSDSTDPVAAYQAAEEALQQVSRAVRLKVSAIVDAAGILQGDNWQHVQPINLGEIGWPQSLAGGLPLDCANLPSGRQLADALLEWHRAEQALRKAHNALP